MKKNFLALIIGAFLLTNCTSDVDDFTIAPQTQEIAFNTDGNAVGNNHRATTRSIVSDTIMTQDFSVWGYMSGAGVQTAGYLMDDASFDKVGNPMNGEHYYWIVSDDNSNVDALFTCLSPISQTHSFANNQVTTAVTTPTDITSPKNDNSAVDILYASVATHPTDARIPVTFKHALSWIEFQGKFAANITSVTIKSIKFSTGLNTTGNFVLNTTNNGTSWNTVTTSADIEFGDENVTLNNSNYTVLSDALVIPQNVPTQVTIVYDITLGGITYTNRTITKTINTGNDANNKAYETSFVAGYKYIYRIYVTASEILFTPVVEPWQDTNDTNNTWQIWDTDAVSYVQESFFIKASMLTDNLSVRA